MSKNILENIDLLLMDVDGVLTNGNIIYSDQGYEIKHFNVKDGLGIKLLLESKIKVGIVTNSNSLAIIHRCKDLNIKYVRTSVKNKAEAVKSLLNETNILAENTAFVGDDLPDLSAMAIVGLPIAVADADKLVLRSAKLTTFMKGGHGAIREIAELILKSKGKWEKIIERLII